MPTFSQDFSLKRVSNYKIGGTADYFVSVRDSVELIEALRHAKLQSLPVVVLGGATNLLIGDDGIRGLVLKPNLRELRRDGDRIIAGAGVPMVDLLEFAAVQGLSGLEWAGGLPGTLGGAVRGNAGAFGGEIKDVIASVGSVTLDTLSPQFFRRTNTECRFGYRTSVFKERGSEVITHVTLQLIPGDTSAIRAGAEEKLAYRLERHPMEYPNIGSIFKNVDARRLSDDQRHRFAPILKFDPFPVVPAAYLLSEAGLKGVSCAGAMISVKHPNFIVNALGATAGDVETLIALAKARVQEHFGIELEEEVVRM